MPLISYVAPRFSGWKVALLLYLTLHSVQGYAALCGDRMPRDHRRRSFYVLDSLPEVFDAYDALYSMSRAARYDPRVKMTGMDVKVAKELRQYILGAMA